MPGSSPGMTRWVYAAPRQASAFSRHDFVRVFEFVVPLSERGQGKPGANRTRSLEGNKKQAHQLVTTSSASHTGFPRAMV